MNDVAFLDQVTDRLSDLAGVEAVALGGSRATGTDRADSDWDFALYYRERFDPQSLRDLGWRGRVFEIGEWGGGVFNGGAWLEIDGRKVDVHYRDLQAVEFELSEANAGRFRIEQLMFHLAGIPTYLVVAEMALNRVLRGELPKPGYPQALRTTAPSLWRERAELVFDYARVAYAARGQLSQCLGSVVQGASCSAHAILAARAQWITNEKALIVTSGLSDLDRILAGATTDPIRLTNIVDESRTLCSTTLREALRT